MFRILALDGGGIKGAFTAAVLAEIEVATGLTVADHFDLIVGTSTGGILAIGLGMGLRPGELLELYRKRGGEIFSGSGFLGGRLGGLAQLLGPKHSQDALRAALKEYLGDKKLGHSMKRLVIPTYEALRGRVYLMKTAHHANLRHDIDALAVDVALATSAAPTYFKAAPYPLRAGESYLDGGLWANTPVMVGLIEAVAFLGQQLDEIDILSIGTTDEARSFSAMKDAGALEWNVSLIDVLMRGSAEAALAQAGLLLRKRPLRVDITRPPGSYSLDGASPGKIDELAALGRTRVSEMAILREVQARFVNGVPAAKFQPMRAVT